MLFDDSEGVDDVGAQGRVDVLGLELGRCRAILGPVRVVADTHILPVSYTQKGRFYLTHEIIYRNTEHQMMWTCDFLFWKILNL